MNTNNIEFTRINNDANGNPRYVCHFLNLLSDKEQESYTGMSRISSMYSDAVHKARKIGGKKYHTKSYGGGIVFQSYNLPDLEKSILELVGDE